MSLSLLDLRPEAASLPAKLPSTPSSARWQRLRWAASATLALVFAAAGPSSAWAQGDGSLPGSPPGLTRPGGKPRPVREPALVLTPALWSVLAPPLKPVAGTDSRVHLSYELLFTNVTKAVVRVQVVEVIDPAHPNQTVGQNRVMTDEGDDVTNRLRPLAISPITLGKADYSDQLEPGQSALMYFDVTLQPGEAIPHEVAHRITLSQAELQNAELHVDQVCWSGYPPHKHDTDQPGETAHEGVYHWRFRPQTGFGAQL